MTGGLLHTIYQEAIQTVLDLAPIVVLIGIFQFWIIRRTIPHLSQIFIGLAYVAIGLTLFRIGIEESLIPLGREMARQLVEGAVATGAAGSGNYLPILAFAGLIGFTATLIEPTLTAAADRVQELSGGSLRARVLRTVIACGVALGLVLGTLRIVTEFPLAYLLAGISLSLILLALTAPRGIVPLALDSGGIATSVVTVPWSPSMGSPSPRPCPTRPQRSMASGSSCWRSWCRQSSSSPLPRSRPSL